MTLTSLVPIILLATACSNNTEPHGQSSTTSAAASTTSSKKDPASARKLIASGALVIDVRTADEFTGGHVPNAINIPVDEFARRAREVDTLVKSDKAAPIVLYCASGRRAVRAQQALSDAGYTNVVNGGGFDDVR